MHPEKVNNLFVWKLPNFKKCAKDLNSHIRNGDMQMDTRHREVFNIINLQANANKKQWFTTTHPIE